jgi:two-component system chemotaxis response regulator CheB
MGIDKILIVDDDFVFMNRLKSGLQEFGQFDILTAPDGKYALRLLSRQKVSMVVTDIDMPKMDGLELLAVMTRQFPNVLSIVATSLEEKTMQKRATGDSLFSYLNKPFDHVRLHGEIIKVLDTLDEIQFKAGIFLSSMLPLVHIGKKSCHLEVQAEGGKSGSFYFQDGLLRDASHENLTGKEAVKEMLAWGPGKYWFRNLPEPHTFTKVNGNLTPLIMEGTGLTPLHEEKGRNLKVELPEMAVSLSAPEPALPAPQPDSITMPAPVDQTVPPPELSPAQCRVLIVDDSNMIRRALCNIFSTDTSLEVIGEAANGEEALEIIKQKKPDVVTLDILMPVMDGLTTLKHMMIQCPVPTVMLSALTHEGASVTFDTLKYGAVDFIAKPSGLMSMDMDVQVKEIIKKVHLASEVRIESVKYIRSVGADKKITTSSGIQCRRVVCLGAAEGGYGALLKIIPKLSTTSSAAHLVMLHASPQHVDAFVHYLDNHSSMRILRAENGILLEGATCYLASGQEHATLYTDSAGAYRMKIKPASHWSERTSINMLMFTAAEIFRSTSVGVLLSGSGNDGAEGLQEINRVGGTGIVQNPACCMYKEMAEHGMKHVDRKKILPEIKIAETINSICGNGE